MESTMLVELSNVNQTLIALVEQDERTAYFYIYPSDEFRERFRIRSCWLRNLQPAPADFDDDPQNAGQAPMLPIAFCHSPHAQAPLEADHLSILWSESDDGAFLYYKNKLIAAIPGWTLYVDTPAAYSAECVKESWLVYPLGDEQNNVLFTQAQDSQLFLHQWQDEDHDPWPDIQSKFLNCYEQHFGPSVKYFAIDGGNWPPMAISQHEKDGVTYFLTLGVSIRPMPWVEVLFEDNAEQYRRIELALAVDNLFYDEESAMKMAGAIAGFAHIPWAKISWLGEGHTIASEGIPGGYESFILSGKFRKNKIALPEIYGDEVNLLWASPVYTSERELAHSKPNGGFDVVEKLLGRGVTNIVKPRPPSDTQ